MIPGSGQIVPSPTERGYSYRTLYPEMLQAGRTNTVRMPIYRDGVVVRPASATFALYDPNGTAVISATAISTFREDIAEYSISGTLIPTTQTLGEGWQEVWVLTMGDGTVRTIDRAAALILRPLYPVIADCDLEQVYPDLAQWRGNVPNMQGWIDEAWARIIGRLISEGVLPYLVKSSEAFRTAHLELALSLWATFAAKGRTGANFLELAKQHAAAYESAWRSIRFTTDDNHDGRADDPTRRRSASPIARLAPVGRPRY